MSVNCFFCLLYAFEGVYGYPTVIISHLNVRITAKDFVDDDLRPLVQGEELCATAIRGSFGVDDAAGNDCFGTYAVAVVKRCSVGKTYRRADDKDNAQVESRLAYAY